MRILGIDPGAGGALVLLDGQAGLQVWDMPVIVGTVGKRKTSQLSEAILAAVVREARPDVAWLERVHAMPRQGVTSTFNFGVAYGIVRGVLAALEVPVHLVTPTEWKKHFRLGAGKHDARLLACRMFPGYAAEFARVRDDGRAEAALLAMFGADHKTTRF